MARQNNKTLTNDLNYLNNEYSPNTILRAADLNDNFGEVSLITRSLVTALSKFYSQDSAENSVISKESSLADVSSNLTSCFDGILHRANYAEDTKNVAELSFGNSASSAYLKVERLIYNEETGEYDISSTSKISLEPEKIEIKSEKILIISDDFIKTDTDITYNGNLNLGSTSCLKVNYLAQIQELETNDLNVYSSTGNTILQIYSPGNDCALEFHGGDEQIYVNYSTGEMRFTADGKITLNAGANPNYDIVIENNLYANGQKIVFGKTNNTNLKYIYINSDNLLAIHSDSKIKFEHLGTPDFSSEEATISTSSGIYSGNAVKIGGNSTLWLSPANSSYKANISFKSILADSTTRDANIYLDGDTLKFKFNDHSTVIGLFNEVSLFEINPRGFVNITENAPNIAFDDESGKIDARYKGSSLCRNGLAIVDSTSTRQWGWVRNSNGINKMQLEIATGGTGKEPIYVRQYGETGELNSITLLDGSGDGITYLNKLNSATYRLSSLYTNYADTKELKLSGKYELTQRKITFDSASVSIQNDYTSHLRIKAANGVTIEGDSGISLNTGNGSTITVKQRVLGTNSYITKGTFGSLTLKGFYINNIKNGNSANACSGFVSITDDNNIVTYSFNLTLKDTDKIQYTSMDYWDNQNHFYLVYISSTDQAFFGTGSNGSLNSTDIVKMVYYYKNFPDER